MARPVIDYVWKLWESDLTDDAALLEAVLERLKQADYITRDEFIEMVEESVYFG